VRAGSETAPRASCASVARTRLAGLALVCLALVSPTSLRAQGAPLFRLFLSNGTVVACLGEYARVGDRVVFTMPVGDASQLLSLPESAVDWARTEQYADALRAARYAESRGEADFSALAGQVAAVLNEIAITNDPGRKLQLALDARRRIEAWPREHYNYKASDVRQIVQLVDEAISEMRAAAGEQQFDFSLEANVQPVDVPVLPDPTVAESLTTAAAVVELSDDASERMSLLESLAQAIDKATASLSPAVATHLQTLVGDRLHAEQRVEADYTRLSSSAGVDAKARAARADVRGVERVIARVQAEDERLGHKRPERVAALLEAVHDELDSARRLRLARDQWSVKVGTYRSYRRAVSAPLSSLDFMASSLDDIKRLAGPEASQLPRLLERVTQVLRSLASIVPPSDLAPAHTLIESAARLAEQAVLTRKMAVASGAMDQAWQASSAAAGALMLLDRAKHDIESAMAPPGG
jgi:hypothetical protein